jgi:hypothetical protein
MSTNCAAVVQLQQPTSVHIAQDANGATIRSMQVEDKEPSVEFKSVVARIVQLPDGTAALAVHSSPARCTEACNPPPSPGVPKAITWSDHLMQVQDHAPGRVQVPTGHLLPTAAVTQLSAGESISSDTCVALEGEASDSAV